MVSFLEVTEKQDNIKVILPLSEIRSITQCNDLSAFIETGLDSKGNSTGFYTKELFAKIKLQLKGENVN